MSKEVGAWFSRGGCRERGRRGRREPGGRAESAPTARRLGRGLDRELASMTAFRSHGPWRISHSKAMLVAFPRAYFDSLGLPRLDTR